MDERDHLKRAIEFEVASLGQRIRACVSEGLEGGILTDALVKLIGDKITPHLSRNIVSRVMAAKMQKELSDALYQAITKALHEISEP